MTKYKLSAIALALMTSVPAFAASQADSKGFIEDSSADLFLRNAYMNRDYYDGRHDSTEWGQGVILNFNSGFTQGRSEERRVGKECRGRWLADPYRKKGDFYVHIATSQ